MSLRTFIIMGLGNPGVKYECTRHNIGYMVLDVLAEREREGRRADGPRAIVGGPAPVDERLTRRQRQLVAHSANGVLWNPGRFSKKRIPYEEQEIFLPTGRDGKDTARVLLIRPGTFMNECGRVLRQVCGAEKVPPKRTLIICDDVALATGTVRIRAKGGCGGHNGLGDCLAQFAKYPKVTLPRLRVGIGSAHTDLAAGGRLDRYVLGKFTRAERPAVAAAVVLAADAATAFVASGVEIAANRFHSPRNTGLTSPALAYGDATPERPVTSSDMDGAVKRRRAADQGAAKELVWWE